MGSFGEKPSLTAVCATKWGIHGPLYGYITMGYHGILDGKVMDINPYVVIYIYIYPRIHHNCNDCWHTPRFTGHV